MCVISYIYYNYSDRIRDNFINKPTEKERIEYAKQIMNNKYTFEENFYAAKNKMEWIDAITYEDVRKLIRENNFDENSIISILN
jgi:hypothetical protein